MPIRTDSKPANKYDRFTFLSLVRNRIRTCISHEFTTSERFINRLVRTKRLPIPPPDYKRIVA